MKKNQIVKLNHQKYKLLYRYGGEKVQEDLPTLYYIMELEDRSKICGYANDLSCFLKPTIKDIIDYVDSINKENPNRDTTRSLALIIPKQYLKMIKDSLRLRVYAIYNDLVELERWENYVAVVISKKITSILPVVDIVDAKNLAEDIPTIDFEDIDLGSEFENNSTKVQKENTIRFLFTGTSAPYFANKEFEISNIKFSQQLFDRRTCEIEILSDFSIFNSLGCLSPNIVGHVKLSDGTAYEVSEITQMNQINFGGELKTELRFRNWKPVTTHNDTYAFCNSEINGFDLHAIINKQVVDDLAYKIDSEIFKSLGIDFGKDKDNTATAIVESEQLKRRQYEAFKQTVKEAADRVYEQSKQVPSCYRPDYPSYCRFWNTPVLLKNSVIYVEVPADKKDVNDLTKEETKELLQKTNKEKEVEKMKITENKNLTQIIIDEDRKTVTAIATDDQSFYNRYLGLEPIKYVTVAKASDEDDFDPYVGVAMTLAYQLFGSKENFRKFVRENGLIKNLKKEKEAREAAKKEAQEKAEEARKKAATRKAKRAAKRAEHDEKIAAEFLKKIAKFIDKTDKKTKAEKGE